MFIRKICLSGTVIPAPFHAITANYTAKMPLTCLRSWFHVLVLMQRPRRVNERAIRIADRKHKTVAEGCERVLLTQI